MKKQNSYTVMFPIAGALHIDVSASSEEEAIEKAWERFDIERTMLEELSGKRIKISLQETSYRRFEVVEHGAFMGEPQESFGDDYIAIERYREGKGK